MNEVTADSRNALKLLGASGAVLWHDFGNSSGVTRACKLLAKAIPIFHIEGTWLALYLQGTSQQFTPARVGEQSGERNPDSLQLGSC